MPRPSAGLAEFRYHSSSSSPWRSPPDCIDACSLLLFFYRRHSSLVQHRARPARRFLREEKGQRPLGASRGSFGMGDSRMVRPHPCATDWQAILYLSSLSFPLSLFFYLSSLYFFLSSSLYFFLFTPFFISAEIRARPGPRECNLCLGGPVMSSFPVARVAYPMRRDNNRGFTPSESSLGALELPPSWALR